ncbi:hypothetical protein SULI_02520 [Saccharolobus solfataricus]|uniref:Uncharacterized protein n=2 Tax=Saccharolobus solfataricus TaxID=2287 RepID=A0A0E3K531_SACSO|nr:hypothetical protein [Saccharolobus solfataricus]AKA72895.1 hypothetical protein SULB_0493 [Saccharolobus solfataricus]AKA75594.1 hypothetical protein SULC_0491 [Saccharolobus solfataricus]AKA78287.1 hypothetical protein SULA_0491 [Saccharolobus solfataricus]AZF67405.1 hypothetical protein SULG_02520 [Saccharolobus solfataricus]AZF70025.1 hypothetical protein SULH_02520 [Saccharolobus solfataricus]
MSSRKIIPTKLPVIGNEDILPLLPRVSLSEYDEVMLRCKACNQILPISKALNHQLMHKEKGEDACFIVEMSKPKHIWYSNEII